MKYLPIDSQLFIDNRERFVKELKPNSLAIFNSNDIMPTNADGVMPFRQNNDLFYLCGVDQEETVLVIYPDAKDENHREMLFVKETSDEIAIWEGAKLTHEQAFGVSGIKAVHWVSDSDAHLKALVKECDTVYLNKNIHSRATMDVETRDDRFAKEFKEKNPGIAIENAAEIMHKLRAVKSDIEIAQMQTACDITEKGFRRILKFIKPGVMEYEIEAELSHEFLRNRATGFAYSSIIASGFDACVLHYVDNNKECKDGEVILMDFGAEYANYASDMTRSVPVSGKFTQRQRDVYNAVLRVLRGAYPLLTIGKLIKDYHAEVGLLMEEELIGLGLLNADEVKKQDKENPLYKKYFMHGTSHFLGLDVHDVGNFDWPIQAGNVFTCEPGIYIREENLGIRLENDLLITENGVIDLMGNIPIEAGEIEELMNS